MCWIGRCVKQHNIPAPVDGSWGEWTAHSGCSRTCGGGVAISKRRCEQPKYEYSPHTTTRELNTVGNSLDHHVVGVTVLVRE